MPHNLEGKKVAEFTDTSGRHFVVIERNQIRFIQQTTMGKTHGKSTQAEYLRRDGISSNGAMGPREGG